MAKIAVIGNEEFTFGFDIAGMDIFKMENLESIISKDSIYGIIIMEQLEFDKLSIGLKTKIENLDKPIFIYLDEDLNNVSNINKLIKKALGIELKN